MGNPMVDRAPWPERRGSRSRSKKLSSMSAWACQTACSWERCERNRECSRASLGEERPSPSPYPPRIRVPLSIPLCESPA
jgi:hypothetical protein